MHAAVAEGASMHRQKQFAPPWRDLNTDGSLGEEYGPSSSIVLARHLREHRDWSFRPVAKQTKSQEAQRLRAFMRLEDGTLRTDVPDSEVRVYLLVVERGHSVRYLARHLGMSRETVRSYLRRLRARAW